MIERAPPKVNLSLCVMGLRGDGYHEIWGLTAFGEGEDVCDEVEVEIRGGEGASLEVVGERAREVPVDGDNTIMRAARAAGREGIHVKLTKRIPAGRGYGGGSSDAAAFLRGLVRLGALELEEARRAAREVDSDCAVCFEGKASWVGGRGEEIYETSWGVVGWAVLAAPGGFGGGDRVETRKAYVGYEAHGGGEITEEMKALDKARLVDVEALKLCVNDLEETARRLCGGTGEVLADLKDTGANWARASGSGSGCVGWFGGEEEAKEAARVLGGRWWSRAVRLV